ncbi:hypothetical protein HNR60_001272 [Rhodopseudomonas rhenobacensis]|uniref:Uncharacterized protein n=1 Tax=Rhodopseudomonas rhenobacensis TaxID=87461 RepID=A0A7W7Z2L8_9BRAD|nr:hypothetical protein [Rhodopseudomonas rhenobacensis]MBB5046527.1 hypothetical protein [Rhodopseudomonas rhenobacensis]
MASSGGSDRLPSRPRSGDGGPDEAAHYLATAVGELARLARRHQLDMLGYLLEMAHLEATELVRQRRRHNGGEHPR